MTAMTNPKLAAVITLIRAGAAMQLALTRLLRLRGVTFPQYETLLLIQQNNDPTLGNLADLAGCSRGNLTGIADRLEDSGLVVRVRSKEDRRVVHTFITDRGRQLLQEAEAALMDAVPDVPDAVQTYMAYLVRTVEAGEELA